SEKSSRGGLQAPSQYRHRLCPQGVARQRGAAARWRCAGRVCDEVSRHQARQIGDHHPLALHAGAEFLRPSPASLSLLSPLRAPGEAFYLILKKLLWTPAVSL